MRIIFDETRVCPQLPGVILLSHGNLAEGLLDAARVVFSEIKNAAAFCLEPGDDLKVFQTAFVHAIQAFTSCIVLVDMQGGTPCNLLIRYAKENCPTLQAVAGVNLPMLLEVLCQRGRSDTEDLCATALKAANTGITDLSTYLKTGKE